MKTIALILLAAASHAAALTLGWNRNPEPDRRRPEGRLRQRPPPCSRHDREQYHRQGALHRHAGIVPHELGPRRLARESEDAGDRHRAHVGRLAGITLGAALEGTPINVRAAGEIVEPSWAWDVDTPVFLGLDGLLTQAPGDTAGAVFTQVVGMPTSSTSLFISPGQPITLA